MTEPAPIPAPAAPVAPASEQPIRYEVVLLLGNLQPVIPADTDADDPDKQGGRTEPELVGEPRITVLPFPHGNYLNMLAETQMIVGPTAAEQVGDPNDATRVLFAGATGPAWVECSDTALASIVASHYGCAVGRPADWPTGWPQLSLSQVAAGYDVTVEG